MEDLTALKDRVCREIDAMRAALGALSKQVYDNPEIGFQEHKAMRWLGAFLTDGGFAVEPGIAGLQTAFRAEVRGTQDRPCIALLAEYDALPGLGHACGHNLICTASVGAAVALRRAVPRLPGTLTVLGTPAEEGDGGKVTMVERGIFEGVDAAMMFHPARLNLWTRGALAAQSLTIRFRGRSSHAAATPEKGVNALNGLLQTFHAIDSLRQHVTSDVRIHGIITHGGDAANVVPAFAEGQFIVRAGTQKALAEVMARVKRCADGGAAATGARVEFAEGLIYAERNNNRVLAGLFGENLRRLGVEGDQPPTRGGVGSSDIGNVSLVVPTIHPYLSITSADISGHTPEFREAAGSARGFEAMVLAAKGLTMTALDVMYRPDAVDEMWSEFRLRVDAGG
ncbi:MAG TPA: M20 family metallopeptidase [bacterium]|nr:M20 family metallopeptidase [bacterium]